VSNFRDTLNHGREKALTEGARSSFW